MSIQAAKVLELNHPYDINAIQLTKQHNGSFSFTIADLTHSEKGSNLQK
ncbi:MAG: hypothetical protein HKN87_03035 [Saprospiraceae bacterium]|nr:hypothetical protein [Saprospiraceae bacterium]